MKKMYYFFICMVFALYSSTGFAQNKQKNIITPEFEKLFSVVGTKDIFQMNFNEFVKKVKPLCRPENKEFNYDYNISINFNCIKSTGISSLFFEGDSKNPAFGLNFSNNKKICDYFVKNLTKEFGKPTSINGPCDMEWKFPPSNDFKQEITAGIGISDEEGSDEKSFDYYVATKTQDSITPEFEKFFSIVGTKKFFQMDFNEFEKKIEPLCKTSVKNHAYNFNCIRSTRVKELDVNGDFKSLELGVAFPSSKIICDYFIKHLTKEFGKPSSIKDTCDMEWKLLPSKNFENEMIISIENHDEFHSFYYSISPKR